MSTPAAPHGSRCLVRSFPPSSPHRRQSTAGLPVPSQRGSQCRGPAVPRLQAPELSTTSPVLLSAGLARVAVLSFEPGVSGTLSWFQPARYRAAPATRTARAATVPRTARGPARPRERQGDDRAGLTAGMDPAAYWGHG